MFNFQRLQLFSNLYVCVRIISINGPNTKTIRPLVADTRKCSCTDFPAYPIKKRHFASSSVATIELSLTTHYGSTSSSSSSLLPPPNKLGILFCRRGTLGELQRRRSSFLFALPTPGLLLDTALLLLVGIVVSCRSLLLLLSRHLGVFFGKAGGGFIGTECHLDKLVFNHGDSSSSMMVSDLLRGECERILSRVVSDEFFIVWWRRWCTFLPVLWTGLDSPLPLLHLLPPGIATTESDTSTTGLDLLFQSLSTITRFISLSFVDVHMSIYYGLSTDRLQPQPQLAALDWIGCV